MRRSGLGRADPGYSSAGRTYNAIDEVWGVAQPGQGRKPDAQWYSKSRDYWETTDLTVNGVLGGYESISDVDIGSSRDLIRSLPGLQHSSAIDCGAGIGRVTEHLLLPLFDHVDMIEQSAAHVEEARRRLASHPHMRHFVVDGLQSASPPVSDYDLVWIQWVVGYLTDDDLVAFFDRCASALRDTDAAYIVVKENVAKGEFFLDADDNNVTRTMGQFRAIFRRTRDLVLVKTVEQRNFPKELHGVYSFVLKRRTHTSRT